MAIEFGGSWTEDKLDRLRKYLQAYMKIFSANERAKYLVPVYVDAFAGAGYRVQSHKERQGNVLFPGLADPDAQAFLKGSAQIALEVEPPFKRYIFIEQDRQQAEDLKKLRERFPTRSDAIEIIQAEANSDLIEWCEETDWDRTRAVVFLDPFGMEVEWALIEALADTRAVDLWLLFPLGVAVNRLLRRFGPPDHGWEKSLTRFFGTDDWKETFYTSKSSRTLFGEEEVMVKDADFDRIAQYFVSRLKKIFAGVADNPLPLRNSKNVPLYLLCFAVANPKAVELALKIATHILGGRHGRKKQN